MRERMNLFTAGAVLSAAVLGGCTQDVDAENRLGTVELSDSTVDRVDSSSRLGRFGLRIFNTVISDEPYVPRYMDTNSKDAYIATIAPRVRDGISLGTAIERRRTANNITGERFDSSDFVVDTVSITPLIVDGMSRVIYQGDVLDGSLRNESATMTLSNPDETLFGSDDEASPKELREFYTSEATELTSLQHIARDTIDTWTVREITRTDDGLTLQKSIMPVITDDTEAANNASMTIEDSRDELIPAQREPTTDEIGALDLNGYLTEDNVTRVRVRN